MQAPQTFPRKRFSTISDARQTVLHVTVEDHLAQVELRVGRDYPYFVCCERFDGLWREASSGNGWNYAWLDGGADDDI